MVSVSIMMLNEVVVTVYVLSYDYSSILLACLRSGWDWGDFGANLQVSTSFLRILEGHAAARRGAPRRSGVKKAEWVVFTRIKTSSLRGPPWGAAASEGFSFRFICFK